MVLEEQMGTRNDVARDDDLIVVDLEVEIMELVKQEQDEKHPKNDLNQMG